MGVVCIVGFDESRCMGEERDKAQAQIKDILTRYDTKSDSVISGDSPKGGVDKWVRAIAESSAFNFKGYPPNREHHHWVCQEANCYGYKNRNLDMARDCTELYCIVFERVSMDYERKQHISWNGGMWTMREVEKLGKPTHLIIV